MCCDENCSMVTLQEGRVLSHHLAADGVNQVSDLRLVCKAWRDDIDAEVKGMTLSSTLLSEIRDALCLRFEGLERLKLVGQVVIMETPLAHGGVCAGTDKGNSGVSFPV